MYLLLHHANDISKSILTFIEALISFLSQNIYLFQNNYFSFIHVCKGGQVAWRARECQATCTPAWVLETKLVAFERATSILNHKLSLQPQTHLLKYSRRSGEMAEWVRYFWKCADLSPNSKNASKARCGGCAVTLLLLWQDRSRRQEIA